MRGASAVTVYRFGDVLAGFVVVMIEAFVGFARDARHGGIGGARLVSRGPWVSASIRRSGKTFAARAGFTVAGKGRRG
jgi:hypothetical protein